MHGLTEADLVRKNKPRTTGIAQVCIEGELHESSGAPTARLLAIDRRLSRRALVTSVKDWNDEAKVKSEDPKAAAVFVEAPVYRKQAGLWEHQKFFVKLAFDAHLHNPGGARFVLADQVGLGNTVQLAMAAELMALAGDKPVLVLAPKTLLWQWQDELVELLDMPSAVWTGKHWVDENEVEYPAIGPEGIRKCPRRVGIVPTSRATFGCADAALLKTLWFECIIVDEAHNARRQNLGEGRDGEKPDPNNLLAFLYDISPRTKSMLLATATPVQLRPVEAWDLLDVLSRGSEAVLGGMWSKWRRPEEALPLVMGDTQQPTDDLEMWQWIRTPLPPRFEHRDFEILRRSLSIPDVEVSANGSDWDRLKSPDKARVRQMFSASSASTIPSSDTSSAAAENILRKRTTRTNEPYLKPIAVELLGERDEDAIKLPLYLQEAYGLAEEFCRKLGERMKASGFLRTLLLRRVGSSITAGRRPLKLCLVRGKTSMQRLRTSRETKKNGKPRRPLACPEHSP